MSTQVQVKPQVLSSKLQTRSQVLDYKFVCCPFQSSLNKVQVKSSLKSLSTSQTSCQTSSPTKSRLSKISWLFSWLESSFVDKLQIMSRVKVLIRSRLESLSKSHQVLNPWGQIQVLSSKVQIKYQVLLNQFSCPVGSWDFAFKSSGSQIKSHNNQISLCIVVI